MTNPLPIPGVAEARHDLTDAIYAQRYEGMGHNKDTWGPHNGYVKRLADRTLTMDDGDDYAMYGSSVLGEVSDMYRDTLENAGDLPEEQTQAINEWEQDAVDRLLRDAVFENEEEKNALTNAILKDLRGLVKKKVINVDESDSAKAFGRAVDDYIDQKAVIKQARAAYKSHSAAKRAGIATLRGAKQVLGSPGTLITHSLVKLATRKDLGPDPESIHRFRRIAQMSSVVLMAAGVVVKVGYEFGQHWNDLFDSADQIAGSWQSAQPTPSHNEAAPLPTPSASTSVLPTPEASPLPAETGAGSATNIPGPSTSPSAPTVVPPAETGANTPAPHESHPGGVTPADDIEVSIEHATRSHDIGKYEWDDNRELWKGTVWYEVDSYARELGIRDQLDTKEFRAIVDQALIDNKIGGEGASYAERWEAAKHLESTRNITLDITLFEGKTDKPLVVAGTIGETPAPTTPAVDRFKEDNTPAQTIKIEGQDVVIQKDGDVVVGGVEINTAVPEGATFPNYLEGINKQFDPSEQMSRTELQLMQAKLMATPEVAEALGLDPKNPAASPIAYYGNLPAQVNEDFLHQLLTLALDKDKEEGVSSSVTPSPSVSSVLPTPSGSAKPSPTASSVAITPFVDNTEKTAWVKPALIGLSAAAAIAVGYLGVEIKRGINQRRASNLPTPPTP